MLVAQYLLGVLEYRAGRRFERFSYTDVDRPILTDNMRAEAPLSKGSGPLQYVENMNIVSTKKVTKIICT